MKKKIINDIIEANKKYQIEFSTDKFIAQNIYRKYGNYSIEKIYSFFGNWSSASTEAKKQFKLKMKDPLINEEKLNYEKKIIELESEIKELRKEKNTLLLDKIDEDKIISEFEKDIIPIKIPKGIKVRTVKENKEIEAILMISDLHASETVYADELEGTNEYNLDIMFKRLNRIFKYFIYYCNLNKITKVNIFFLGDLFTGDIHDELIRTNELNVVDTNFLLLDYFFEKLLEIEPLFSSINVEILVGNHGRFKGGKPEYKTSAILNWEYIFAENLKRAIKFAKLDSKIIIHVNKSLFKTVEVAKRKFLILHGHILTGSGTGGFAGLPIYSLAMSSAKFYGIMEQSNLELTREVPFQDILMGHLHNTTKFGIFNGGNIYINGCIIGINEYSLFKIRGISKIEQTMLLVSEGKIVAEHTLWGK